MAGFKAKVPNCVKGGGEFNCFVKSSTLPMSRKASCRKVIDEAQ